MHYAMCMELKRLIGKISKIYPDIEAARPGASGIKALCLLQNAIEKGRLLIQNCSESSRFYLAITGQTILSRCERTRKFLEHSLSELRTLVPSALAFEISQIIDDVRSAAFMMDASEEQAGNVVRALLRKDESFFDQFGNSEIRALQFAAFRLHLISQKDLLIEKSSIKKMLNEVSYSDRLGRTALKYLLHLLKKHDKLVLEDQTQTHSLNNESFSSELYGNESLNDRSTYIQSRLGDKLNKAQPDMRCRPVPPLEFKCPISSRIMYDPVVTASGQTFERMFIQRWFDEGNDTCPTTEMKLADLSVTPDTAMRGLISKWCEEHGVHIYESNSKPLTCGALDNSSNSICSCGSSLVGLHLPIDLCSVSLGAVDTNYGDGTDNFSKEWTDNNTNISRSSFPAFKFFSSTRDLELGILSDISQFPWESQCMAIEDVQSYLNHYNHAHVPLRYNNFIEPIVRFLKDARDKQALKAQMDGAQLLLTDLHLHASRSAMRFINEDFYALLTSFLGTQMTEKVLAIFELLSVQGCSASGLVSSGALISILDALDTLDKSLQEMSIKILYNLSVSIDPQSHNFIPLLDCIPRLVPILANNSLSRLCLWILKNLCCVEKARILAAEAEGCVGAIAGLLDVGSTEDQENVVSFLLSLCSQNVEICRLVMDVDNFMPDLILVSINGNEEGKAKATELLRILRQFIVGDDKEEEASSFGGDGLKESNVKCEECQERGSRKAVGFFRGRCAAMLKKKR